MKIATLFSRSPYSCVQSHTSDILSGKLGYSHSTETLRWEQVGDVAGHGRKQRSVSTFVVALLKHAPAEFSADNPPFIGQSPETTAMERGDVEPFADFVDFCDQCCISRWTD